MFSWYERLIFDRPWLLLAGLLAVVIVAALRLPETSIETSADTLVLEGDEALKYYRDVRWRYPDAEFLLIAWSPLSGDVITPENRRHLQHLSDELTAVDGVTAVVSLLDVPLLRSPPQPIGELVAGLRTLRQDPDVDAALVRAEFKDSPIYTSLVANRDLTTAALQVLLAPDQQYSDLLKKREALRARDAQAGLSNAERAELKQVSAAYKKREQELAVEREELVSRVRTVLERHRQQAQIYLGGVPMITADMVDFVRSDLINFGLAILVFFCIFLAVIFRGLRWVLLPLGNCLIIILLMLGLLAWMGWNMTIVSANFLVLLLVITLSFSMHLMVRYRELHALNAERSRRELVRDCLHTIGTPCCFMALTTMVSFVSLFFSGVRPIIDFGWMLAMGTIASLCCVFILIPAMLMLLPQGQAVEGAADPAKTVTRRFAALVDGHGGKILLTAVLLFLISGIGISRLEVETRFIDYFDQQTEIYRGMEVIDRELGGTMPLEVVLFDTSGPDVDDEDFDDGFGGFEEFGDQVELPPWFDRAGLERVEQVHDYLDSLPETGKVLSLATTWKLAEQLLGRSPGDLELALLSNGLPEEVKGLLLDPYLDEERRETRLALRVKETSRDLRRHDFLLEIDRYMTEELGFSEDQFEVTGLLVLYDNLLQSLFRSQILTFGTVSMCIFLMFILLFRSFSLALLALVPNLLAAGLVLGGMGLSGLPLDLMTVTIAAIVLGVGVDNTIHYVWRFKREFNLDRNYQAAMYRSHGSIGRAMYYTSVTIILGFSILALSNFRPSIYFGLLTSGAMAAALLGALVLLPQLILSFKPLGPEARD